MKLEILLKIVGWVFTMLPLTGFISVSIFMLKGVAKDDSAVLALLLLGLTMFVMGIIILMLIYLSDFFTAQFAYSVFTITIG